MNKGARKEPMVRTYHIPRYVDYGVLFWFGVKSGIIMFILGVIFYAVNWDAAARFYNYIITWACISFLFLLFVAIRLWVRVENDE